MKYLKNATLFFFMLIGWFPMVIGQPYTERLDGIWKHDDRHGDRWIDVVSYRNGLKIKGIHSNQRWSYFEFIGKNTFMDRFKNKIHIKNKNKLSYYHNSARKSFTFRLVRSDNSHNHKRYYDDDHYFGHSSDNRTRYEHSDDDTYYGGGNDHMDRSADRYTRSVEGTWAADGVQRRLYIVDTRDGIKARFAEESKWYIYKNSSSDPSMYLSESGSSYRYIDNDNLVWTSNDGAKRFYLKRLSTKID